MSARRTVFMAPNGRCYHLEKTCTYLQKWRLPDVQSLEMDVDKLKNGPIPVCNRCRERSRRAAAG